MVWECCEKDSMLWQHPGGHNTKPEWGGGVGQRRLLRRKKIGFKKGIYRSQTEYCSKEEQQQEVIQLED